VGGLNKTQNRNESYLLNPLIRILWRQWNFTQP